MTGAAQAVQKLNLAADGHDQFMFPKLYMRWSCCFLAEPWASRLLIAPAEWRGVCLQLESCHDDFECADGLCLPKDWVCDGHADCRDSSDEHPLLCTNWKKRPLVASSADPVHAHPDIARDSGDPCERMDPQERQRCWDDQLHKLKVEELQLRQRVASEQLEAAQAELAAAKQLRHEQLQAAQLHRQAAQELLQQQQELHTLRLQTLKHAITAAEPMSEAISSSDLHAAETGSGQAAAAAVSE